MTQSQGCLGCLGLTVVFVAIIVASGGSHSDSSPNGSAGGQSRSTSSEPTYLDLNARVNFSGTQFTITNLDTFDWRAVRMEINGGLFSGGYELETASMAAGEVYTVGAMQFAKGGGERFNPFTMKPQEFCIYADGTGGKDGIYCGSW